MLLVDSGQAVAGHALQVGLQIGVATGDLGEELPPGRAIAARGRRGDLGHAVGAVVRALPAGPEIDHPPGRVEQPGIGIPLVGGGRVPAIGARQSFHAADGAGGGELGGDLRVVGLDAAWRQTLRIRSVAASVSSVRQRCPSHTSHRPQVAT